MQQGRPTMVTEQHGGTPSRLIALIMRYKRWRYARRMMTCIDKARRSVWDGGYEASKTDGLRVIRRFERVNKCTFDPWNACHVDKIDGWGAYESFHRALRLMKIDA